MKQLALQNKSKKCQKSIHLMPHALSFRKHVLKIKAQEKMSKGSERTL